MKSVCHFILIVLWGTLIILSSVIQICSSCVLEERRALLDFKASLNGTEYPDLILPSWIDDNDYPAAGSDCCSWEGVKCDGPGRIVELQLGDLARDFPESYFDEYRKWYANLSILVPLENLQALNLSYNRFDSSIFEPCGGLAAFKSLQSLNLDWNNMDNRTLECLSAISSLKYLSLAHNEISSLEGCEQLTNFKNLESLNLDWNYIGNTSLHCIITISSLKNLSMASNGMQGLFPFKEINGLKQLQYLDLSYNYFSGPLSFKELKLENLELLRLRGISDVDNPIEFSSIDVMTSLKALYLDGNEIKNSSIVEEICSLKNLVELGLRWNSFGGNIPLCLSNLTSLKFLDISNNNFSGNIPSLVITSLLHLESLILSGNHFEGSFSFGSFANHSKLQVFTLQGQDKEIYVNFDGLPLPPPFQLSGLSLVQCNLNNETRRIPDFLLYQKELRGLDLSSNNLVGKFPNWLLENNRHLKFLRLRNNSFNGSFLGDGTLVLQDLQELDISSNEVSGQLPQDIGFFFPSLKFFNLSRNCFQGSIPGSLGVLKEVLIIDLSHNNFSGKVPDRIGTGCVQLQSLILSNNSLHGHFPSNSVNLSNLLVLFLDSNHFVGSISDGLSHSSELQFLDISNNQFQGKIPTWIGNFSSLHTLDLSGNMLEGTIPDEICKLEIIFFLDLSGNGLNGSILSCSNLSSLRFIQLQGNQFTGSIPNALLTGSKDLITLNLRHNRLSGGIPRDITKLTKLQVLLLGENNLQGQLPMYICRLKNLNIVDLSQNNFSGRIPACLNGISFGREKLISNVFYIWVKTEKFYIIYTGFGILFANFENKIVVEEEFRTKSMTNTYTGNILNLMSGLDLSCNQLTGEIPEELCDLRKLRALNLSHNNLQGSIPSRLSLLSQIESLDLSYNNFSGQIPYELTNLHWLSNFNVSYNNLSGKAPDQGQFADFDENNYRGNPGLCGPLLQRHCGSIAGTADPVHDVGDEYQNDGGIDTVTFFWGFFVSLGAALATLALSLYLSPQYRRVWFGFIDAWILFRFYYWYRSRSK